MNVDSRREQQDFIFALNSGASRSVLDRLFPLEPFAEAPRFEMHGRHFVKIGVGS